MSSTMDIVRDVRHTRTPMLLRSRIVDTITGNVLFTVMTDARGCRPNEGITYLMDSQNACVASIDWVTHVITVNGVQLSFSCFLNTVSWTHMNSISRVCTINMAERRVSHQVHNEALSLEPVSITVSNLRDTIRVQPSRALTGDMLNNVVVAVIVLVLRNVDAH